MIFGLLVGSCAILNCRFLKALDKLPYQTIFESAINCRYLCKPSTGFLTISVVDGNVFLFITVILLGFHFLISGVSKHSIIDSLLFSITLASLHLRHDNSRIVNYADDISLSNFVRNIDDDSSRMSLITSNDGLTLFDFNSISPNVPSSVRPFIGLQFSSLLWM